MLTWQGRIKAKPSPRTRHVLVVQLQPVGKWLTISLHIAVGAIYASFIVAKALAALAAN